MISNLICLVFFAGIAIAALVFADYKIRQFRKNADECLDIAKRAVELENNQFRQGGLMAKKYKHVRWMVAYLDIDANIYLIDCTLADYEQAAINKYNDLGYDNDYKTLARKKTGKTVKLFVEVEDD